MSGNRSRLNFDPASVRFEILPEDVREKIIENTAKLCRQIYEDEYDNIERIPLAEWQEKYRVLPQDAAEAGRMSMDRTPYLREIAEKLDSREEDCQVVCVKKGAQVGASELAVSFVGKLIHSEPCSIMLFGETAEKARRLMKSRVMVMLGTEAFKGIIGKPTQSEVQYPGGLLSTWGANSPASFSSTSAAVVILDELSRYPRNVGGEGTPFSLSKARISTFGDRGKLFIPSTPLDNDNSEGSLESIYQSGDCREFYIPCPHCGEFDYMRSDRFDMDTASVVCVECGELGSEEDYKRGLLKGEWRPTKERNSYNVVSYRISGLTAPYGWNSWKAIAQDLQDVENGKATKQAVMNLRFGEGYEEEGIEVPTPNILRERHETDRVRGTVPKDCVFLTMAVDLQQDYMVWCVEGWAANMFSRHITHGIIRHDFSSPEGKKALAGLIENKWDGRGLSVVAIDSGDGRVTSEVYNFASGYPQPIVYQSGMWKISEMPVVVAVKGSSKLSPTKVIERSTPVSRLKGRKQEIRVWSIGTSLVKKEIYNALSFKEGVNRRYRRDYPADLHDYWYEELVSEKPIIVRDTKGNKSVKFVKASGARNEALDMSVYNRAAAQIYGSDDWTDKQWEKLLDKASGKEPERKKRTRKTAYKYL